MVLCCIYAWFGNNYGPVFAKGLRLIPMWIRMIWFFITWKEFAPLSLNTNLSYALNLLQFQCLNVYLIWKHEPLLTTNTSCLFGCILTSACMRLMTNKQIHSCSHTINKQGKGFDLFVKDTEEKKRRHTWNENDENNSFCTE